MYTQEYKPKYYTIIYGYVYVIYKNTINKKKKYKEILIMHGKKWN